MSRSSWKFKFISRTLLKKNFLNLKQIKIWAKYSIMHKGLIDKRLLVYCGKSIRIVFVKSQRIFFRVGEFCMTRSKFFHKNKIKAVKTVKKIKK
jgi:ribosomal protein S19